MVGKGNKRALRSKSFRVKSDRDTRTEILGDFGSCHDVYEVEDIDKFFASEDPEPDLTRKGRRMVKRCSEAYPLFRSTTQPSVNNTPRFSLVCDDDWDSYSLSPDGASSGRSRAGSSVSKASKHSAPTMVQYRSRTPTGVRFETDTGSVKKISSSQNGQFFDFTGMSKPYTLTYINGGCTTEENGGKIGGGEIYAAGRKQASFTLNHKNSLGAKAIIARRASMKDHPAGRQERQDQKFAKMRRQATVETSTIRAKKSPSEEGIPTLVAESAAFTSTQGAQRYVRRRSSVEISEHFPSSYGVGDKPAPLTKADKKRMEKLRRNMKELLELFTAVEQDDIGKVRIMLQHGGVDVNGENMDDLTLLDVATMLNHNEVAQLLLKHGAQENPRLSSLAVRSKKLQGLIECAQTKLAEIRLSIRQNASQTKEMDRQLSFWESRLHMLKKMSNNFENSELPEAPKNIGLQVASASALRVTLGPPESNPVVVTRYKIEWSLDPEFRSCEGSLLVKDLRRMEVTVPNLVTGCSYYVQVSAGNLRGYGTSAPSHPGFAIPSTWREVDERSNRGEGHLRTITELYHEIRDMRMSETWDKNLPSSDPTTGLKKKKSSLKNLFSASTRFQKTLKKGIYLASVLYKEDKVLCTVDDNLPVILVDENTPSTITAEVNWLMKVSCAWEDSKWLQYDTNEACQSSPNVQFRQKLLDAASQMQAALGVQDLGRLHCRPITDSQGSTLLVTVQYVSDVKTVQGLAVKWMPMTKLLRKQRSPPVPNGSQSQTSCSAMEILLGNLLEHLNFYESTYIPLDKGLYLCYMKLHASINDISIVVPENLPSVLPFVYLRDNPHVSKEEWEWLKLLCDSKNQSESPSSAQLAFHWSLVSAAKILLNDLEVPEDVQTFHRLYRLEVIEVHSDVSFLLIVPKASEVCSAPIPNNTMTEEKRGCLTLPLPVFEMAHLCTYQPDFISIYCRLSAFLDFFILILQQMRRQAFSDIETLSYRKQLDCLCSYQQKLEDIWKSARWITEVTSHARDKQSNCGVPLGVLFSYSINQFVGAGQLRHVQPGDDRGSDQSDNGEDNSDVGYHSDQSIEKTGVNNSGSQLGNQSVLLPETSGDNVVLKNPISNPTYDWPDALAAAAEPNPLQRSNRVYINLLPTTVEYVNQDAFPPALTESTIDSLVAGKSCQQRLRNESFLQANYASRRYLNQTNSRPSSFRTHIAVGSTPVSLSTDRPVGLGHEYVNVPSSSSQYSEDSDSTTASSISATSTPKKSLASASGTVSDTELMSKMHHSRNRIQRQAVFDFDHHRNFEDLSVIDHLYSVAANSIGTAMDSSPKPPRPETAPPTQNLLPISKSMPGIVDRNTSRSSSDRSPAQPGVLRVYAAYACGLAKGTSVKLQLTPKTTSREVVNLVVQQLNKAVQLKGLAGPLFSEDEYEEFCLVAVIGARERCLRDDFAPLELQNPWAKGRLFVRRRDDLLAALEYGNEAKV